MAVAVELSQTPHMHTAIVSRFYSNSPTRGRGLGRASRHVAGALQSEQRGDDLPSAVRMN